MLEVLARIRHRRTRRQLSPYLDGMLSVQESRRLEAHLTQCQACRDELAELRATVQALAELPLAEAPRSFALTAAPRRIEVPRPAARRLEFGLRLATVTAAFVFAVVAFGDLLGVPGGDEEEAAIELAARMEVAPTETGTLTGEAQPSEATVEDKALTEAPTAAAPAPSLQGAMPSPVEAEGYGGGEPPAATVTEVVPELTVPGIAEPATTPAATAAPAATATPAATGTVVATPAPSVTGAPASGPASETPLLTETGVLAETPTSVETPSGAIVEYTLRPGESVWDVAASFGTTAETILALNGLADPGLVVPGQRLLVPGPAEGTTALPPADVRIAPSETEEQPLSEADEALAEAVRETRAVEEEGGPSRESVVRWLEIGLATGVALLFVSWVLARRRGRA